MVNSVVKIFTALAVSFTLGIMITPIVTNFLYKHKMWKTKARNEGLGGGATPLFNALHKEREVNTPRMGGIIIWVSVLLTVAFIWAIAQIFPNIATIKLNFLSREQVWLPLFTLIVASLIGLVDDYLQVRGGGSYVAGGLSLKKRVGLVLLIGLGCALWFYIKLGISTIGIPFVGNFDIGLLFIPLFMIVMLAVFSGGVIDGIDGLSGGIFAAIFSAYAGIAFSQGQFDLSALCATIVGGTLAFLWFNIPPARFYMGETGILGLTVCLSVVAFLTRQVLVLPIIAFPLLLASGSDIIQILSKKFRGKKVFLIAPIHHHFEALGWPPYKVTMRFWILSIIFATVGMVISIMGSYAIWPIVI